MNVQMDMCRHVKEGRKKKGETRRSLDSPDALFGTVSLGGELSSDYSQI